MKKQINVEVPEKLVPLFMTPKPLKIAVGGRGSGKTVAFSDGCLKFCDDGERVICAREFQNSIDESVHSSLVRRIQHHGIGTLKPTAKSILGPRGGKIVYLGLARNLGSIKSFDGASKVWIEEGQYISQDSIDLLFPTIRENNSEIWVSMNRGSSKDAISKSFLSIAEQTLKKTGFYEDDYMMIIDINYRDNPWFPEKLEIQRNRDFEMMSRAKYDHIWNGHYSDTVDNAIILPEWFDACIDAHKKLGFDVAGREDFSYDPADTGDAKAIAYKHGPVVKMVKQQIEGRIDSATDWAISEAIDLGVDSFIYDADGIGGGLKSQIEKGLKGKVSSVQFKGSETAKDPDSQYEGEDGKTNREMFTNKRAQAYWNLREAMHKTWLAVEKNKYADPDSMISFCSSIEDLHILRAEICSIPRVYVSSGRIQLMSKPDMKKKLKLDSPNMADAVAMLMLGLSDEDDVYTIDYGAWYD